MLRHNLQVFIKKILPAQLRQWLGLSFLIMPILCIATNRPPVAHTINKALNEDKRINIALKGIDPQRKHLSYTIAQPPDHGNVTLKGKSAIYTPDANYFGQDGFQYTVNNGEFSSTAAVKLKIRPVNDRPTAQSQYQAIPMGEATAIALTAFDVEEDALNFSILSKPKHGKVVLKGNIATYTPRNAGFRGNDQFAFRAKDKRLFSKAAKVNITVATSTGSESVIQTVKNDGAVIELPSKVRLTVPSGSLQSAAIQVAVIAMPELDTLLAEEKNYSDTGAPRLKIKSSVPLDGPIELKIPLPENLRDPNLSGQLALFAVEPESEDAGSGPSATLTTIESRLCEAGTSLCGTLEPGHFLPVPTDPADPIIKVVLLLKVSSDTSSPLKLVHPIGSTASPANNVTIDINQPINFKVSFEVRKYFPNLKYPLPNNPLIVSAYKELRQFTGTSHRGLDLKTINGSVTDQPVTSVLDGKTIDVRMNDPNFFNGASSSCIPVAGKIRGLQVKHTLSGADFFSRYWHLKKSSELVTEGMEIKAGIDTLATSGSTGACNSINGMLVQAPHLHFEVTPDWYKNIDPRPLLPGINDTSLFLLPHDNANQSSKDIGLSPEPHLRLRLVFNNGSPILGVNEIDKQFVSTFATITTQVSGGEVQTGSVKGNNASKTKLTNPLDTYGGRYANIAYDSGSLTLANHLQAAASHPFYQQNGLKLEDIVEQSKVVLELCTFRLSSNCIQIASWDLNRKNTQVTVDATTGSTGKGAVMSEPPGVNCQTGSNNQCSYAFSIGDTAKLTSTPSSGSTFAGWSGPDADKCIAGSEPTVCNLPLDGVAKNIVASFKQINLGDYVFKFTYSKGLPLCQSFVHQRFPPGLFFYADFERCEQNVSPGFSCTGEGCLTERFVPYFTETTVTRRDTIYYSGVDIGQCNQTGVNNNGTISEYEEIFADLISKGSTLTGFLQSFSYPRLDAYYRNINNLEWIGQPDASWATECVRTGVYYQLKGSVYDTLIKKTVDNFSITYEIP
jgi:murein DD-endopeptidase MepM/ murein hydrolase activator NlpD